VSSGGTADSVGRFAGDAFSLAKRAVIGLNEVRKLINIETKVLDLDTSFGSTTTTDVYYASGISQGTDIGNRVGDSIKIQSLSFRGHVTIGAAATSTRYRLILVRDMQNQGSLPTAAQIFETVSAGVTERSPPNYINRDRFAVLYDEFFCLNPATSYIHPIEADVPLDRHIRFRGTTNGVASAAEGSLFWVSVSSEGVNFPTAAAYLQLTFTDD